MQGEAKLQIKYRIFCGKAREILAHATEGFNSRSFPRETGEAIFFFRNNPTTGRRSGIWKLKLSWQNPKKLPLCEKRTDFGKCPEVEEWLFYFFVFLEDLHKERGERTAFSHSGDTVKQDGMDCASAVDARSGFLCSDSFCFTNPSLSTTETASAVRT